MHESTSTDHDAYSHAVIAQILRLCLSLERVRESPEVVLDRALVPQELHVGTIHTHLTSLAFGDVLVAVEWRETPLLRDDNLLPAWELVL